MNNLHFYHIVYLFIILNCVFKWSLNVDHVIHPRINVSKQDNNFVEVSYIKTKDTIDTTVSRLGTITEKTCGASKSRPQTSEIHA